MNGPLADLISVFQTIWLIISHGGWAAFVVLAVIILYKLYLNEIQTQYIEGLQWTFLEIKPPRENPSSFYSAELVFIQLHQLFDNWTFQEKYLEGRVVWWMSLEIISLGGKISYIMKVPTKYRDLVESALFANYPSLEINEVEDYLSNFDFDPDNDSYNMFGAEFEPVLPQSIPIRTYREFEGLKGPESSTLVVDPLASLFEVFTRLSPNEFYGLQFIIRPAPDDSWRAEAEKQAAALQGDKEFFNLDDITKLRIAAIKSKIGRQGFYTKIRILHLGTSDSFNKDAKKLLLSPFKIFSSSNLNSFKPTFSPKLDYRISPTLEAPYINYYIRQRKIEVFKGYKSRSTWIGNPMYILNTEELATLFHFPITSERIIAPPVETTEFKKVQPPANLPI